MSKETLIKARELIQKGWVQGDLYRKINGKMCYCLDGAVAAAHGHERPEWGHLLIPDVHQDLQTLAREALPLVNAIYDTTTPYTENDVEALPKELIYMYNDNRVVTKEDVIALLDKAIATAI